MQCIGIQLNYNFSFHHTGSWPLSIISSYLVPSGEKVWTTIVRSSIRYWRGRTYSVFIFVPYLLSVPPLMFLLLLNPPSLFWSLVDLVGKVKENHRVLGVIDASETDSERPIMSPPFLFQSDTDQTPVCKVGLIFSGFIGHLYLYHRHTHTQTRKHILMANLDFPGNLKWQNWHICRHHHIDTVMSVTATKTLWTCKRKRTTEIFEFGEMLYGSSYQRQLSACSCTFSEIIFLCVILLTLYFGGC